MTDLDEQEAANERAALTVADLRVVNGVGLHDIEETLLAGGRAKELVVGIGAIDVAPNDLLARRLTLDVVAELVARQVGLVRAAHVLPRDRPQVDRYALAYVVPELCGPLLAPLRPLVYDLIPQLPADLVERVALGHCNVCIRKSGFPIKNVAKQCGRI